MKLLFIIPTRNEGTSLPLVVHEVRHRYPRTEILVIDDASEDAASELLAEFDVHVIRLSRHSGVGATVRRGLRYARSHGFDAVVRVDADGQHVPDEIPALLRPLEAGETDAVVGSRYMGPDPVDGDHRPLERRLGGQLVAALLMPLVGRRITDPTSGFWAFGRPAIELLARRHPDGYGEPLLHILLHRHGLRVTEVSVRMRVRMAGQTSLTVWAAVWSSLKVLGTVLPAIGEHWRRKS